MNIEILCIGNLKEAYWRAAAAEYSKRLAPYCKLSSVEIKESKLPKDAGVTEEENVKQSEGEKILAQLGSTPAYVIALDVKGHRLTSPELAAKVGDVGVGGMGKIVFVIGGSLGLSEAVLARAELKLSFSDMTFPHQMMRVILLEQIYRSYKILRNEPYHK
jgi:23S rRNA (pseudouridine1915-N3)-methyltransferase